MTKWGGVLALASLLACRDDGPPPFRNACASLPRLPSSAKVELVRLRDGPDHAVALVQHPTDDQRFYIVVKDGNVQTYRGDGERRVVLDISASLAIAGEAGLLGMAFDPDFASNGFVYLSFTVPGGAAMTSRIARFHSDDDGLGIDPASEEVVLEVEQPYSNHNGGHLEFGPDGMLYFGLGDGGSAGDPHGNGQDPDALLGKLLRIDVRALPYAIPPDNPFADGGGAPEVWAMGLRNPWRWGFDRESGALWLGDVGQNRFEEVDVIVRGGNYGWGRKEGFECIGTTDCDDPAFVDPIAAYRNNGAATVVGGQVLRGSELGELEGAFVYSDFYDGTIWAVRDDGMPAQHVGDGARSIAHWLLAKDGSMLALDYEGDVHELVATTPDPAAVAAFPRKLSETGCIDTSDPDAVPEGLVAYEVALPFWSDGADKLRFVALPEGGRGRVDRDAIAWPVGTTLVKTFAKDGIRIETRLLARHEDGWRGYGYAWDDDGVDATLVEAERIEARAGSTWIQPGLRGCPACHTDVAGGPLGTTTPQLARTIAIDGAPIDQLAHLVAQGVIDRAPNVVPLPSPDSDAPLEEHVRAYLHVNCSPCHREDGTGGRAALDLRRELALADTGLCGDPRAGDLELADAKIVAPGDPARSVLSTRLHATGDLRMPPLATAVVDEAAAAMIDDWIQSLGACP
ncbi:MAG TPA: PQQ-dependent sugar dehydrogenase [Nannocystaceae bacterium]|nr:PQQ-dependent sugar dehydrogenase [Nannocystaceae bacterium]